MYLTQLGNDQLNPGVELYLPFSNFYGVNCDATIDLVNIFGGGLAEGYLNGSYCNTDGFVPAESSAQAINGNLKSGLVTAIAPLFGHWYGSFATNGNILVGIFTFCSQYPVGQHNVYACVQGNYGPYE